eukprot:scaffold1261_cov78-Skeletonema_dohrnii-CCMP3373.AAC.2
MMTTDAEEERQLRPDGSAGSDDNSLVINMTREARGVTSGSTGSSNWSGTAAAVDSADALTLQNHPELLYNDILYDVATTANATTTSPDGDHVKLCEEGLIDDNNKNKDNGNGNIPSDEERLSLLPSIITIITPSESDEPCLPEDTFSYLVYSHPPSRAFFLAMVVLLFQITIYFVLALNIIDVSNGRNPLKLPVNVGPSVRVAEVLAIVVAIISQDGARKAVNL